MRAGLGLALVACVGLAACTTTSATTGCAPRLGTWLSPATLRPVPDPLRPMPAVTLLGERHDQMADHLWQLRTLRDLAERQPHLALGLEMFPREDQEVLDRWVAGELSEAEFLRRSRWKQVWGFDPLLYLPIFRFARAHRIPMLALNVRAELVHSVAMPGLDATPAAAREGVGQPAAANPAYRARLASVMSGHGGMRLTPERLEHFIDAQLLWDRAMAEAIRAARLRDPGQPVTALIGEGHLAWRDGVPHQLDRLGLPGAVVLLPADATCTPPGAGYADAILFDDPAPAQAGGASRLVNSGAS